jgi:hypothetical protein
LANDPNEPAKPIPNDEPFEVWWQKYLDRVNESVVAAEQYLEVPAGTVSSIPRDPDFIATVKTFAVVEPVLNDLIVAHPPQPNYLGFGLGFGAPANADQTANFRAFVTALTISGRTGKLKLAEGLGLVTQDRLRFIKAVAQVRNRYAHNVRNMHRSLTEMLTEEQESNARIVETADGVADCVAVGSSKRGTQIVHVPSPRGLFGRRASHTAAATAAGGRAARGASRPR